MTDLQLGLLVIGAAAVAGVLLYNRLQERGTRREAQRAFSSRHVDVLLDDAHTRREPTIEPVPAPLPRQRRAEPDGRIDYVIELDGVNAAQVQTQWAALERRFARRAILTDVDEAKLQAALQMVSRNGVVSEADLLEFRSEVETIAAAHGASVAAPEMRAALDAAQRLDRACAEVDAQIALHVLGIVELESQNPAFQVSRRADGITLLLDVPRTPELAQSYETMVKAARRLASSPGARLVDDNGNPLDERALAAIGVEVETMRARLAELRIEPGSPLALRLFS
jgi:FtsZ-interacting cell division protein ZipA